MSEKYLNIILDIKKNTEYTENIARCLEKEKIHFQKDTNYFNNSLSITGFLKDQHYKICKENYDNLKKFYNMMKKDDFLVSCNKHYNNFIIKLFNGCGIKFTKLGDKIMYFNKKETKNQKFMIEFLRNFDIDIIETDHILNTYFNMKKLNFPRPIDFNSEPRKLIRDILFSEKIYSTDFYEIPKDMIYFKENLNLINNGGTGLFKFNYVQNTLKSKYILLMSLLKVNDERNLPNNYIHKMIKNLKYNDCFETGKYFYYKEICKVEKIENFQYTSFNSIEEAMSYIIDLELSEIRGVLIETNNKYNICYENKENIPYENNINKNKDMVIKILQDNTSDKYDYSEYSLKDLINIQILDSKPYSEFSEKRLELPFNLFINKGVNIYNLTGNILDFENKQYPYFKRDDMFIGRDLGIDIELIEKIDMYYSPIFITSDNQEIICCDDFYIPEDVEEFETGFKNALDKGFLVTDLGIIRYTNDFHKLSEKDIFIPDWFSSKTYEEYQFMKKFFKEIKYI